LRNDLDDLDGFCIFQFVDFPAVEADEIHLLVTLVAKHTREINVTFMSASVMIFYPKNLTMLTK
jgi:hypothetical protein